MRYRKLDASGDYSFGHASADFYRDQPEAVAQAIQTRLLLFTGDWFLDTGEGTPWRQDVLGKGTQNVYDIVLQERILDTPGVLSIDAYSSQLNRDTRSLSISATVTTAYGTTQIQATLR